MGGDEALYSGSNDILRSFRQFGANDSYLDGIVALVVMLCYPGEWWR